MIYMLFRDLEQCQNCLNQININKGLESNRTNGEVQEITNTSHCDYIEGYRAVIPKPIFINSQSKWLDKCDIYEYDEGVFDVSWFDKPKAKLKNEIKAED